MIGIFGVRPASVDPVFFPATTKMLFQQTNAPTGWTKDATHNDKSLRVVTGAAGSGGATGFSSVFGAAKVSGSTAADLAAHVHTAGTLTADSSGAHTHTQQGNSAATSLGTSGMATRDDASNTGTAGLTSSDGAHTHAVSGSVATTGAGGGHTHTLSLDLNFVDVIIATKD